MWSVEPISEKKKKPAPPVEEHKSDHTNSAAVPTEPTEETTAPVVLIDLSDYDPKKIAFAEEAGFPIRKIVDTFNNYVATVEARFKFIAENVATKEDMPVAMEKALMNIRNKQIAEAQKYAQEHPEELRRGGGGGVGDWIGIAKEVLGGESSNPLQEKMNTVMNALLDQTLLRINKPSRFEELLDEEIAKTKAKAIAATITGGQ